MFLGPGLRNEPRIGNRKHAVVAAASVNWGQLGTSSRVRLRAGPVGYYEGYRQVNILPPFQISPRLPAW